jgi:DNA mismatch repair protein MutS
VTGDNSYLEAKELRHPIIERIIDGPYVTNDLSLGKSRNLESKSPADPSPNGVLLFGVNQTGKSSLAKAIALNIIMAQIGCFVPAKLRYKPYSKIITRLSDSDNIFKGQSSFAVEMTELRTILRQSDSSTLVIGDELCHGTESHSGMAITASTILSLIEMNASFIFATHMHELLNLECMKTISDDKLRWCHLSISYDEVSKILIYDRKLRDGSGASVYGLMVARSLDLPKEFLDRANSILLEITGNNKEFVDTTQSRYNPKLYVDVCAKCGRSRNQIELHTHHIQEQSRADERGLIENMDKNAKDNLIVLCRDCHTMLHRKGEELQTLSTSEGKIIRMKPNVPLTLSVTN